VKEIPLEVLNVEGPIQSIYFNGNLTGTFYLDDVRLVAVPPPLSATAVLEEHTASLPQAFALAQNFPNPFNSSTVIHFSLPEDSEVELVVYNIAGQQVARLAQGRREAGTYTVNWNGRDERGQELASGMYLYRLRTGREPVEARKLLLIR
jgi:hypothetical protein